MGLSDKISGRLKKTAGEVADDPKLRKQGEREERKGEAEEEAKESEQEAVARRREAAELENRT